MLSKARMRANKKYLSKQEEVLIRVRKGRKDKLKVHAESVGLSLNAYINNLINKDIGPSDY